MILRMLNKARYLGVVLLIITACTGEEEKLLLGDPNVRMNELLAGYKNQLTSSPYGWKAFLYPGQGGGFNFHMQFSSEGRVIMVGDINLESASEPMESSYSLVSTQRPSLFFDTYTYLHQLSDPDPDVYGGIEGHGYLSDFEFAFESTSGDTIRLKGNQHQSELMLVKATRKESDYYSGDRLKTMMTEIGDYLKINPYLFFIAEDNRKSSISINPSVRRISLLEENNEELEVKSAEFSFTTDGILLHDALTFRGHKFQEIRMDTASNIMYIEPTNGNRIDVKVLEGPVFQMHKVVGVEFFSITLRPDPVNSPGWSSYFKSTWISMDEALDNCCGLRLSDIQLLFNIETKAMDINIYVRNPSANGAYRLRYPYTFTKTWDGVFTFTPSIDEEPNYNAKYFEPITRAMLDEFNNRKYKIDYLKAGTGYVGQMKSQDFGIFYFAGELQ